LIGKDGKEVEVEAKIDTGADSTSIDTELARELGFGETVDAFSQIDISGYDLKPENENDIKQQFLDEHGDKIPNLENIAIIFSASGSSMRPVIKITFTLEGIELVSKINITNRTNLTQQMIVGKRDLRKFLIQV
jgi:hypothetical protein